LPGEKAGFFFFQLCIFGNGFEFSASIQSNNQTMKQQQLRLAGTFLLLVFLLSSCWFPGLSVRGNGNVKEEVRQVDEFDRISASRGVDVYITQGSPQKVVVVADDNLLEVIQTKVHGHELQIYADENIRRASEKKVMVTVESLHAIEASSGANVYSQGQIRSEDMTVSASSGANQTLALNVKDLRADCSSGANIRLSGIAKEAELETSSGANLISPELQADQCKMSASSGGNVSATVTGKLEAHASSGGNVAYYGEPASVDVHTSSGGNIRRK
jgi:hypothetical protein